MPMVILGISDLQVSNRPEDTLITYSLGSCIGATAYDPIAKIGGMLHYMLPLSKIAPDKARRNPAMFADTGIPLLLKKMYTLGASKKRMIIRVAGGSHLMDQNKIFNIGERNYLILRKILWKNSLLIKSEDVGGNLSRTVRMEIDTGMITVKSSRGVYEL